MDDQSLRFGSVLRRESHFGMTYRTELKHYKNGSTDIKEPKEPKRSQRSSSKNGIFLGSFGLLNFRIKKENFFLLLNFRILKSKGANI